MAKSAKRRSAGARKGGAKGRPRPAGRPRRVQLKPVFNSLERSLERLKRAEQTGDVKRAIARLSRCLNDIDGICGSDMVISTTRERRTR